MKVEHIEWACDYYLKQPCRNTENIETVSWTMTFDGQSESYQIDLCPGHRDMMAGQVAFWSVRGRPVRQPMTTRAVHNGHRQPARRDRAQTQAIRAWAKSHKMPVNQRGRIPTAVEEAFAASHRSKADLILA